MVWEVTCTLEPGRLRAAELRRRLGREFLQTESIPVSVPPGNQTPAYCGVVLLRLVAGGRGHHRRLVCPGCDRTKLILFVSQRGTLACRTCLRVRTRRQRDRTCQSYTQLGGREEEDIVRLLLKPGPLTEARLALATSKIEALLQADRLMAADALAEGRHWLQFSTIS